MTHGDAALVDLAGRLAVLDQRHDEDEIEQAYVDVLGVGQEQLLQEWAAWAAELAADAEPFPATERG